MTYKNKKDGERITKEDPHLHSCVQSSLQSSDGKVWRLQRTGVYGGPGLSATGTFLYSQVISLSTKTS